MKKEFSSQNLPKDLSASVIVFLVALPLCLGIALASKAPEFSGIIAGIIGGLVIGVLSKSPLSVSGPAAGLSSLVAGLLTQMPFDAFLLSVLLAGVIQILLGVLKLGIIGDYIPNSVIKGMLAGIGLLLILKQFQHLIGYDKDFEGDEAFFQISNDNTFTALINSINGINLLASIVGFSALAVLIFFDTKGMKKLKFTTFLSGPLVAVLLGIFIEFLLRERSSKLDLDPEHFVNIPIAHSASEFFKFFTFPDFNAFGMQSVWTGALLIALVASIETLLSIEAVDKMDPDLRITPTNRELIAQGAGNIFCGLVGGLPMTSVIVRSSANVNAGAKTKVSSILHGALILICVITIPNLLNLIPKAALAAILVYTGYKMVKPSVVKHYYKLGWDQFIPFIVTLVGVVSPLGLLYGVLLGIAVGLIYVIRANFRKSVSHIQDGQNHMIRLKKDVFFFTKPLLKEQLMKIEPGHHVIIDVSKGDYVDRDIVDTINEYQHMALSKEITVEIKQNPYFPNKDIIILDKSFVSE
jgi:MFS superfamily sulfate permease-like transporter